MRFAYRSPLQTAQLAQSMQGHDLAAWLHSLLPAAPHHLPLIYHTPTRAPPRGAFARLVLSITPTAGVYAALTPDTALFLHRPWALERRRLHLSTLVCASHQRLDELLTTGYNEVLMRRLGVQGEMHGIVGYKKDPERKMGLVGLLHPPLASRQAWRARVEAEFGGLEGDMACGSDDTMSNGKGDPPIKAIACMNAFEPDFLHQVVEAARSLQQARDSPGHPASSPIQPNGVLYITGETKPLGAAAAQEQGMPVIFVGHGRSEQWAIMYLAEESRRVWGPLGVEVVAVVDEPEEPRRLRQDDKGSRQAATRQEQDAGSQAPHSSAKEDSPVASGGAEM